MQLLDHSVLVLMLVSSLPLCPPRFPCTQSTLEGLATVKARLAVVMWVMPCTETEACLMFVLVPGARLASSLMEHFSTKASP